MRRLAGAEKSIKVIPAVGSIIYLPCMIIGFVKEEDAWVEWCGGAAFMRSRLIRRRGGKQYTPVVVTGVRREAGAVTVQIPAARAYRGQVEMTLAEAVSARRTDPVTPTLSRRAAAYTAAYVRGFMEYEASLPRL